MAPEQKKVTGVVSYDVRCTCPHCGKCVYLNEWPYDDDTTEYGDSEDAVGMMLFGGVDKPAQWGGLTITIKCYHCEEQFTLTNFTL